MAEWKRVKIGDALNEVSRVEKLNPNTKYRLLGVRWYGKGVFQREEKLGKEIKATKLYQAKKGDFIYNRLFAWKMSFAIVPDELDGCLVSNEFPLFICDESKVLADFLLSYILLPQNIETVNRLSGGMSSVSRKRFKEIDFLNFEIPQYDISFQKSICQKLKKISDIAASQDLETDTQLSLLNKLRQAVLQEAVEGKLTAEWRKQNPHLISGENHASKLLEKIWAEKDRLIKKGEIRKEKCLPPIADDEKPFTLPGGWSWCRLGEISDLKSGNQYSYAIASHGVMYIRVGDMNIEENNYEIKTSSTFFKAEGISERDFIPRQSIIFPKRGGAIATNKRRAVLNTPVLVDSNTMAVIPSVLLHFDYFFRWFGGIDLSQLSKEGVIPQINNKDLLPIIVPIPPLAEQKAIVDRADKLMGVIDELEKQVSGRKDQSEMLMQSVLQEAFAR